MDSTSLEKLTEHFNQKVYILKHAMMMSNATMDDEYIEVAQGVDQELDSLSLELKILRKAVENEKKQLEGLQDIKCQSQALLEHLQYTTDNVPTKLPHKQTMTSRLAGTDEENNSALQGQSTIAKQSSNTCQYLDFITVEEFETVPKYMKGRLTYDKINSSIEQLDKVFIEKYKILKRKKSTLNDVNRKRYEAFKLQENKDTRGAHFVIEKDITEFSTLKIDNTLRNILTILRHCGLMHEIRGDGYVRFAGFSRY